MVHEFRLEWRSRFPFFAVASDEFRKTLADERWRVGLTIAFDRRTQELRHALQDLNGSIFGVAAETNYRGNIEIAFPERLRQTVRGPILFLARNAGA